MRVRVPPEAQIKYGGIVKEKIFAVIDILLFQWKVMITVSSKVITFFIMKKKYDGSNPSPATNCVCGVIGSRARLRI